MARTLLISYLRANCDYDGVSDCMQELAPSEPINFPSRWTIRKPKNYNQTVMELDGLAQILVRGCEAIAGVYMRLCDEIREGPLTDNEVREVLGKHFPPSRVSEILKVSRAPKHIYLRYTAGFFGFKAALKQCRLYKISPSEELKRRQIRRTAGRLVTLMGTGTVIVSGRTITVA